MSDSIRVTGLFNVPNVAELVFALAELHKFSVQSGLAPDDERYIQIHNTLYNANLILAQVATGEAMDYEDVQGAMPLTKESVISLFNKEDDQNDT